MAIGAPCVDVTIGSSKILAIFPRIEKSSTGGAVIPFVLALANALLVFVFVLALAGALIPFVLALAGALIAFVVMVSPYQGMVG